MYVFVFCTDMKIKFNSIQFDSIQFNSMTSVNGSLTHIKVKLRKKKTSYQPKRISENQYLGLFIFSD